MFGTPRPQLTAMIIGIVTLFLLGPVISGEGAKRTRDNDENDSFGTAEEVIVRMDAYSGTLSVTDVDDYYHIMDLDGDNEDRQREAQRLILSIKSTDGANVRGILYEPNEKKIATLVSSGEWSEVEFIVPRSGDYYLWMTSDPVGQSSSYQIRIGGATGVDNYRDYDQNNQPFSFGISDSKVYADALSPTNDVVDYYHLTLPAHRAVEVTLNFESGLPLRLQVLNSTYYLFDELANEDSYVIKNDGDSPTDVLYRVYYPLQGGNSYTNSFKQYTISVFIWSHETEPEIDPSDPWEGGRTMNEDNELFPSINLSRHFREPNGDPLEFSLQGSPDHLNVTIEVVKDPVTELIVLAVFAHVSPEPNWHGSETLVFQCSDKDAVISDEIEITVTEVNDLPYITKIGSADYEGGAHGIYALEDEVRRYHIEYGDDDDPISSLHFSASGNPDFVSVDPDNGTITVSPVQEDVGVYSFNLTLFDDRGGYETIQMNLQVQAVNDPPPSPTINVLAGNITSIFPGDQIQLEAVVGPDPDGDDLQFAWDWSDGTTTEGRTVSHYYDDTISGNRTITLTVSDGHLSSTASLKVFVQDEEGVYEGDLVKTYSEPGGDVVHFQEEWREGVEEDSRFSVSKDAETGVDIIGLSCEARGSNLRVRLQVRDTVIDDGKVDYHIYVLFPGYTEPEVDLNNISDWGSIPDRLLGEDDVIAHRAYLGDPLIHNGSQGRITDIKFLLFEIPINELIEGGLTVPISSDDFSLFASVVYKVEYNEVQGKVQRFVMSDTAGDGALEVGDVLSDDQSSGGGATSDEGLMRPTNIIVVVSLIIAFVVLGIVGFFMLSRERKKKKEEERKFLDEVEKMRKEGKDLFGKEKEKEPKQQVSYESLYGKAPPKGHTSSGETPSEYGLPSAGLGKTREPTSNIMELEIKRDQDRKKV